MRIEMIDKVIEPIDEYIAGEAEFLPFSEERGFVPIKINKDNFHTLGLFGNEKNILVAVDGGNSNILNAPNFSLDFIRVAAAYYKDRKRIKILKKEFFCLVKSGNKDGKLIYSAEFFGDVMFKNPFSINGLLNTIDGENYSIEISAVSGMIRRLSEIILAGEIIDEMPGSDMVIDGGMKAKTEQELKLIKELLEKSNKTGSMLGFLSKTSRMLTKNSYSLNSALNELGPKASWYYHPVFKISNEDYLGDMYFVKLDSRSSYVFKLEIPSSGKPDDFILALSSNSNDPVFYGYPYALIDADRSARVTNNEKEYLKTLILSKIKDKEKLAYLLSNLDSHDVLDGIM